MFLNLGVKSVTMDEIAAEMGISKKTIYAHFPTKTKLIEATAIYIFENISCGIDKIRDENKGPIDELYTIKRFALANLKSEKSSPQYQLQKYYPKIYENLRARQKRIIEDQIQVNIKRGIQDGLYREDLPIEFISRIYFIGMIGIKDRQLFPETDYPTSDLIDMYLEFYLRAIVTNKGLLRLKEVIKSNNQNESY